MVESSITTPSLSFTATPIESSSLRALRLLREDARLLLLAPKTTTTDNNEDNNNDNDDDTLCGYWMNNKNSNGSTEDTVRFEVDSTTNTAVVSYLNFGGRRLHPGFTDAESIKTAFTYLSSSLRTLNLGGTDLPVRDMEMILHCVAPSIVTLYLGGNGLGDSGAAMIGTWLGSSSQYAPCHLNKLDLRYNDITSSGMEALCTGMAQQQRIAILHLEGNNIGDEGCNALSKVLLLQTPSSSITTSDASSSSLVELYLGANHITSVGATYLASTLLSANNTLQKLYLEGNAIGPEGAMAFCEALEGIKENNARCLKHLFVDNNGIGKEMTQRLARAVNSSTCIPDVVS